ncbi:Serine Protease Immune Response Integrator [Carabus blaptoides fortunei]
MEIESKLDEDFVFYLGFLEPAKEKFKDHKQYPICKLWIQKLCDEIYTGRNDKRNRNIFLSNLVLCMEEENLTGPFLKNPPTGKLSNAAEMFGLGGPVVPETSWMADVLAGGDDDADGSTVQGRTYLATKALPDGNGALGYVAVSLDEDEPLGPPQGHLDKVLEKQFQKMVPPISEMERILLNRQNPAERRRVIAFYEAISANVAKEINGQIPHGIDAQVNGLINQLIIDLKKRNTYGKYEQMSEDQRRLELLYLLDMRLKDRINHVKTRESFLDNIEAQTMQESFWDASMQAEDIYKEDMKAHGQKMWSQAINSGPKKKFMNLIEDKYPPFVIKKFLKLLADEKEKIAVRIQRRHENIVSQLRRELRKEREKGKSKYDDAKFTCDEILGVLTAVKEAEQKAWDSEQQRQNFLYGSRKERDEMYEQMRNAMLETQQHVEEEAERGKFLVDQINYVSAQNAVYHQVNEESLQKIEDENMAMMKNIQRLAKAVKQHETRNNMKSFNIILVLTVFLFETQFTVGGKSDEKCNEYMQLSRQRRDGSSLGKIEASPHEFPHMAALIYGDNNNIYCGGSLISEQYVVTTAHCLNSKSAGPVKKVRLGDFNIASSADDADVQEFTVVSAIAHPDYKVPKIIMTSVSSIDEQIGTDKAVATGWGLLEFSGERSEKLMKVELDLYTNEECSEYYKDKVGSRKLPEGITGTMICSGGKTEAKSTCQGDAGGPLQILRGGKPNVYNIIGVISFGIGCGNINSPEVASRISSYVPWIESVVWA